MTGRLYKPSPHGEGGPRQRRSAAFVSSTNAPPLFPSFLWKEVPRRGGGWPRETVLPHSGKPTPPRFARLPLPEEGARMIFKETRIKSLSFAVRDSRPHICRARLRFPHLSFMPPVPYPPLRGTFPSRGRLMAREYHPLKRRQSRHLHSSFEQSFHSGARDNALWAPSPLYLIPQNRSVFSFAHFVSTSSETPMYCASVLATYVIFCGTFVLGRWNPRGVR